MKLNCVFCLLNVLPLQLLCVFCVQMLALALLDAVISVDWHHHWLQFLVRHGYLRHLIDSLVQEDEMLQMALQPNPEPLRALYIYESKMVRRRVLCLTPFFPCSQCSVDGHVLPVALRTLIVGLVGFSLPVVALILNTPAGLACIGSIF